ncbi:recombinase family protein [uncultured Brevibacterium sp.]|uniref:recombinase family protein n=1 Tax=uncultured Brevibacterium sp. TaxID=189678 RepID=UPI0025D7F131|nr:recombinase family protein [uncultured Brevibacterium sp.]
MSDSTELFTMPKQARHGKVIGYVRVSTADQNADRQIEALGNVDKLFIDKASGATRHRPQLEALLEYFRDGDVIRVKSADRLARSTADLLTLLDKVRDADAHIEFVDTPELNTDSPQGRLVITILGAVAEHEKAIIRERQREGIAIAKAKGVYRKRRALADDDVELAQSLISLGIPIAEVARRLEVSRQTVYNAIGAKGAYSITEREQ